MRLFMAADFLNYSHGVIKVYYPLRGFGFITRAKGKDLFFNRRSVENEAILIEGTAVRFKIATSDNRDHAESIEREG